MRRIIALLLAAMLLLSMTACGGSTAPTTEPTTDPTTDPSTDPATDPTTDPATDPTTDPATSATQTTEPTKEPVPETTEPTDKPETTPDPILGVYNEAGNTYENKFLGIGCELSDEWYVFSADEIAQLNGLVAEMMTDEALAGMLENSGYVMPFYAMTNDGLVALNITIENLGLVYGALLDEQDYVEASMGQLPPTLEALGLTDITTELGALSFAGGEHTAVFISGLNQDVEFYETQVCVKVGQYIAVVTVGSSLADVTKDVLDMFYGL